MHFFKIFLFLILFSSATSCKTCNCPAYSYKADAKITTHATAYNPAPLFINNPLPVAPGDPMNDKPEKSSDD